MTSNWRCRNARQNISSMFSGRYLIDNRGDEPQPCMSAWRPVVPSPGHRQNQLIRHVAVHSPCRGPLASASERVHSLRRADRVPSNSATTNGPPERLQLSGVARVQVLWAVGHRNDQVHFGAKLDVIAGRG